jgi:hypothetical protein
VPFIDGYRNSLPNRVRNGSHNRGHLIIRAINDHPTPFTGDLKISLNDHKRVVALSTKWSEWKLWGVDWEWQTIQRLICESFGWSPDSRLVLSIVDPEGDKILMYAQVHLCRVLCD